jgi:hypothetical protein
MSRSSSAFWRCSAITETLMTGRTLISSQLLRVVSSCPFSEGKSTGASRLSVPSYFPESTRADYSRALLICGGNAQKCKATLLCPAHIACLRVSTSGAYFCDANFFIVAFLQFDTISATTIRGASSWNVQATRTSQRGFDAGSTAECSAMKS